MNASESGAGVSNRSPVVKSTMRLSFCESAACFPTRVVVGKHRQVKPMRRAARDLRGDLQIVGDAVAVAILAVAEVAKERHHRLFACATAAETEPRRERAEAESARSSQFASSNRDRLRRSPCIRDARESAAPRASRHARARPPRPKVVVEPGTMF